MAKETLTRESKFKRLVFILGEPAPHVVGHLEMLWHSTWAALSPYLRDAIDVEAAAEWDGEPGEFVRALLDTRFLDQVDEQKGKYRIHRYWTHAPRSVKLRAERAKIDWKAEQEREAEPAETDSQRPLFDRDSSEIDGCERQASDDQATGVRCKATCPDLTCPDLSLETSHTHPPDGRAEEDNGFAWFWERYPRKVSKGEARKAWRGLTKTNRRKANETLPEHVRVWKRTGRRKQMLPYPATWLRSDPWDDELDGEVQSNASQAVKTTGRNYDEIIDEKQGRRDE